MKGNVETKRNSKKQKKKQKITSCMMYSLLRSTISAPRFLKKAFDSSSPNLKEIKIYYYEDKSFKPFPNIFPYLFSSLCFKLNP